MEIISAPRASGRTYLLTRGTYDDYRVLAVFTDLDTAEAALEAHTADPEDFGGRARIETFTLYDEVPSPVTLYRINLNLWDNGNLGHCNTNTITALPWNQLDTIEPCSTRYVRAPIHKNSGGRYEVRGYNLDLCLQAARDAFDLWAASTNSEADLPTLTFPMTHPETEEPF